MQVAIRRAVRVAENPLFAGYRVHIRPSASHWIWSLRNQPFAPGIFIHLLRRLPGYLGWVDLRTFAGNPAAVLREINRLILRLYHRFLLLKRLLRRRLFGILPGRIPRDPAPRGSLRARILRNGLADLLARRRSSPASRHDQGQDADAKHRHRTSKQPRCIIEILAVPGIDRIDDRDKQVGESGKPGRAGGPPRIKCKTGIDDFANTDSVQCRQNHARSGHGQHGLRCQHALKRSRQLGSQIRHRAVEHAAQHFLHLLRLGPSRDVASLNGRRLVEPRSTPDRRAVAALSMRRWGEAGA